MPGDGRLSFYAFNALDKVGSYVPRAQQPLDAFSRRVCDPVHRIAHGAESFGSRTEHVAFGAHVERHRAARGHRACIAIRAMDLTRMWQPRLPLGIFSLTSNPAALAWEAAPAYSDYAVEHRGQRGDYRRPLDAAQSSEILLGASGAARTGSDGGVVGAIREESDRLSPGARVDQSQPFGSSPLVLADTTASAVSATAVDIVGAGGWSLGPFAAGISGAYDTQSLHTDAPGSLGKPRSRRQDSPSALPRGRARPCICCWARMPARSDSRRRRISWN